MSVTGDLTGELAAVVTALCEVDPARLADGEAIQELHRQLDRLEAVATRATAVFDASRTWETDGARGPASWISTRCYLPMTTARRRVRLGRELRHMTATGAAWLAGEIGGAQVVALAKARTPARAELFERDEKMLVDHAKHLRFHQFVRVVAYWALRADPDGAEEDADRQREARRLHLSRTFAGTGVLDALFDPISLAIFEKQLKHIEQELFDEYWAEAKQRVGEGVCARDLRRTPAQRRLDAVVEMARRAGAVPAGARMPEPLFSVFVDYETFAGPICDLANGAFVTPGSLVPYLDRAWIERVVFDGPSRVVDMGVRQRLFTGATRRAVLVKERECFNEFCDVPSEDCQADHIEPYAAGGLTIEANGQPACAFHNRSRHRRT
jgi:hypothetical protein